MELQKQGESKAAGIGNNQSVRLSHSVHGVVFIQKLIKLRNGHAEQNSCDVFKAVNPFFAFRPLAPNIHKPNDGEKEKTLAQVVANKNLWPLISNSVSMTPVV